MKKIRGFAEIPLMIGLLIMAISVPIVTKLAQQNQENRSKATYMCTGVQPSLPCDPYWTCDTSRGVWVCPASVSCCTITDYSTGTCDNPSGPGPGYQKYVFDSYTSSATACMAKGSNFNTCNVRQGGAPYCQNNNGEIGGGIPTTTPTTIVYSGPNLPNGCVCIGGFQVPLFGACNQPGGACNMPTAGAYTCSGACLSESCAVMNMTTGSGTCASGLNCCGAATTTPYCDYTKCRLYGCEALTVNGGVCRVEPISTGVIGTRIPTIAPTNTPIFQITGTAGGFTPTPVIRATGAVGTQVPTSTPVIRTTGTAGGFTPTPVIRATGAVGTQVPTSTPVIRTTGTAGGFTPTPVIRATGAVGTKAPTNTPIFQITGTAGGFTPTPVIRTTGTAGGFTPTPGFTGCSLLSDLFCWTKDVGDSCGTNKICVSYSGSICDCNTVSPTNTPVPTGVVGTRIPSTSTPRPTTCSQVTNAVECGYIPGCRWNGGTITTGNYCTGISGTDAPIPTSFSNCTTVGNRDCYNNNARVCTLLSNGSKYWQSTYCQYGCSGNGVCNTASPTPSRVRLCTDVTDPTECGYIPGCLWLNGQCTGGVIPTSTSACTIEGAVRCHNGNAEKCNRLSNGTLYWQGTYCQYGCTGGICNGAITPSRIPTLIPTTPVGIGCTYACSSGTCSLGVGTTIFQPPTTCDPGVVQRVCVCSNGRFSCFCDTNGDGNNNCLDTVKGTKSSSGVWLHFDDEASAQCICGSVYHTNANGAYACGSGSGGTNPTSVPGATNTTVPTAGPTMDTSLCTQCPSTFSCYQRGDEYRWFAAGYVMEGFTAVQGNDCGGVAMPSFLGKEKGDANCDGSVDTADYSLWHKEFYDGNAGELSKRTWTADFTGADGVCDGLVDIYDYSLWHTNFYELMNLL